METVTIPKDQYEQLKRMAEKLKLIDETIHDEFPVKGLMLLQEKQEAFGFLKDEKEDIYSLDDLKQ